MKLWLYLGVLADAGEVVVFVRIACAPLLSPRMTAILHFPNLLIAT